MQESHLTPVQSSPVIVSFPYLFLAKINKIVKKHQKGILDKKGRIFSTKFDFRLLRNIFD